MRKYYFALSLLFCNVNAMDASIQKIVESAEKGNLSPDKLLCDLRHVREQSALADAFLNLFGGQNFEEEETDSIKVIAPDIENAVYNLGRSLGEIFYKKGSESWEDDGSLTFAKRLLNVNIGSQSCIGGLGVSSTLFRERLDDMQRNRKNFLDSANYFANCAANLQNQKFSEEELKDIEKALAEEEEMK